MPILLEEQEHLIRLLTRAINSGQFGEPRSKTRASAQKVIRDVKKLSEKKASARLVA